MIRFHRNPLPTRMPAASTAKLNPSALIGVLIVLGPGRAEMGLITSQRRAPPQSSQETPRGPSRRWAEVGGRPRWGIHRRTGLQYTEGETRSRRASRGGKLSRQGARPPKPRTRASCLVRGRSVQINVRNDSSSAKYKQRGKQTLSGRHGTTPRIETADLPPSRAATCYTHFRVDGRPRGVTEPCTAWPMRAPYPKLQPISTALGTYPATGL